MTSLGKIPGEPAGLNFFHVTFHVAHAAEKFPSRQRREVVTNFEDLHELRRFIQQTTNGSIQAEVAKVFEKMLLNFANLCKHVKKCDSKCVLAT